MLSSIRDGGNFPVNSPVTEAAGNQDAGYIAQKLSCVFRAILKHISYGSVFFMDFRHGTTGGKREKNPVSGQPEFGI